MGTRLRYKTCRPIGSGTGAQTLVTLSPEAMLPAAHVVHEVVPNCAAATKFALQSLDWRRYYRAPLVGLYMTEDGQCADEMNRNLWQVC